MSSGSLADAIPGARFVELEGMDHFIWAGNQDPVFREVERFLAEIGPRVGSQRALRTVLFTDIVGSTERAAELGDRAWRDLLAHHHRVIREQLARCGGVEIDTAGDGFFAAFERAGGYAAGLATGLLGFAQVFWDANRQAIHDRIVGTVVALDPPDKVLDWESVL